MLFVIISLSFVSVCLCDAYAVLLAGIGTSGLHSEVFEGSIYQTYYQLTELGGIPKENIIVHAMDSVVNGRSWEWPGKFYAYPGAPDTYQYITGRFDCVGDNNSPEAFLNVLKGEAPNCKGTNRTLKAGDDDITFVVTAQHGGTGIWEFVTPSGHTTMLHVEDLMNAVDTMKGKVVFYSDSCHCGSMFYKHLDPDGKVVALTNAPPDASGWMCCPNNTRTHTYFTESCGHHNWHLDSRIRFENQKMTTSTIEEQLDYMKENWMQSKELYCDYGNRDLLTDTIKLSDFQGSGARVGSAPTQGSDCALPGKDEGRFAAYEKSDERDEKNSKIWGSFRQMLSLGERSDPNMSCYPDDFIKDLQCHKELVAYALEKCNFYALYEGNNPMHLSDACDEVGDIQIVKNVIDIACRDVEKEYDITMY